MNLFPLFHVGYAGEGSFVSPGPVQVLILNWEAAWKELPKLQTTTRDMHVFSSKRCSAWVDLHDMVGSWLFVSVLFQEYFTATVQWMTIMIYSRMINVYWTLQFAWAWFQNSLDSGSTRRCCFCCLRWCFIVRSICPYKWENTNVEIHLKFPITFPKTKYCNINSSIFSSDIQQHCSFYQLVSSLPT